MASVCENCGFSPTSGDGNHKASDHGDSSSSFGISSSTSHGACQFVPLTSRQNLPSQGTEHAPRDVTTLAAKEEARIAQPILQDLGHGDLIGDFAIEGLKAFGRKYHATCS